MRFVLILQLDKLSYYGHVPEIFNQPKDVVEVFMLEDNDWPLLNVDFVDAINKECGTLLDLSDVDYFDVERCGKLKIWLEKRLANGCEGRLEILYAKLLEYANQAIELGTGVVVEF